MRNELLDRGGHQLEGLRKRSISSDQLEDLRLSLHERLCPSALADVSNVDDDPVDRRVIEQVPADRLDVACKLPRYGELQVQREHGCGVGQRGRQPTADVTR